MQVLATLVADVIRRRPADRIVFNLAQLTLSWAAAGSALEAVGGTGAGRRWDAPGRRPPGDRRSPPASSSSSTPRSPAPPRRCFSRRSIVRAPQGRPRLPHLVGRHAVRARSARSRSSRCTGSTSFRLLALPMAAVHRASRQASEMEHLALYDPLTGLPNRALLFSRPRALARSGQRRPTRWLALLVLDLDRFRDVNDTLGRDQGDALLMRWPRASRARCARPTWSRATEGDASACSCRDLARSGDAARAARQHPRRAQPPLDLRARR